MKLLLSALCILIFAQLGFGQTNFDYNAVNQLALYSTTTGFKRYQTESVLFVHVVVGNLTSPISHKKSVFFPVVDEFTQMIVPETATSLKNATEVRVWVDFHGFKTPPRFFKSPDLLNVYAASFSVVVTMAQGVITGITWDEGCVECQSDTASSTNVCVGGKNCGINYDQVNNCAIANTCQLQVYMGWVGTDANGYPLYSSSFLPSRFTTFSFTPIYLAVSNTIGNNLYGQHTGAF